MCFKYVNYLTLKLIMLPYLWFQLIMLCCKEFSPISSWDYFQNALKIKYARCPKYAIDALLAYHSTV